jgi:hypothetical protein
MAKRGGRFISFGCDTTPESSIEDLEDRVLQLEQTVAEMRAEMREIQEDRAEQGEN